ncbi:MAG: ammonium transporter [Pirellulaceae bacterium]
MNHSQNTQRGLRYLILLVGLMGWCLSLGSVASAQEPAPDATAVAPSEDTSATAELVDEPATEAAAPVDVSFAFNNAFLFIAAVLVFFMQAGFAMVEAGFNAQKNAVNILFKNSMDICVGIVLFYLIGYGLMYPKTYGVEASPYFGFGGFGIESSDGSPFTTEVAWLFQAVFAATAATIVSGAVAGRMKVVGYLIYSAILTAFIYPISGYWKWGTGFLADMGFQDFAGSAVVHGVGGFAGLAGAIVLGPRIGRFINGKSMPMPGHSLPLAALGVFILWFGWYGFNPGSALGFQTADQITTTMHCAATTTLAPAAGGLVATLVSWLIFGKPDLSMGLNGILGGLVGITACCDCMSNMQSLIVGAVAGLLIIGGVLLLDKLQIDDPVGAFPVHGLCGVWGCMAIGILPNSYTADGTTSFMTQLIGTAVICGWAFGTMFVLFTILKVVGLLRVSPEEEQTGLDISEHGMHAYPAESLSRAS